MKILVINPGSTSTKMAVYEDENAVFVKTLRHPVDDLMRYPEAVQDIPQLRHIAGSLGVEYAYRPDRVDFPCRYGAGRDEKIEPVLSGRLPPVIQERQPQLGFALRQFRQSKFIWRNRLGQRCNLGNFRFAAGITCPIRQHDRELELQAGGLLRGAVYDRKIPPAGIAGEEVLWKEPVVRMQHRCSSGAQPMKPIPCGSPQLGERPAYCIY